MLFIKESQECFHEHIKLHKQFSTLIIIFYFLSSKSAYYNDFWKIMWQCLIIFYNTTVFTAIFIYKCSLKNVKKFKPTYLKLL